MEADAGGLKTKKEMAGLKKWIALLLTAVMTASLAACGNNQNTGGGADTVAETEETGSQEQTESETEEARQEAEPVSEEAFDGERVLIVYYSYSGVTKGVSQRLQQKTGGDLLELIPAEPYSEDMYEASDRAEEERESGNLPELTGELPSVDNYDVILVGGPVWSETLAPPVMTYLEQTDFTGKIVAPFWTYNNNEGAYGEDVRSQIRNGDVREGLGLSHVSSYEEGDLNRELDEWLGQAGLSGTGNPASAEDDTEVEAASGEETPVKITIGSAEIEAVLNGSEGARELASMLPVTLSMTRMGEHEYYGSLENALTHTEELQTGYTVGDLAFWTPGDLLALYFDEPEDAPEGLMILGRITTELSVFDDLGSQEKVVIELAE